jgi:hypothetical protein
MFTAVVLTSNEVIGTCSCNSSSVLFLITVLGDRRSVTDDVVSADNTRISRVEVGPGNQTMPSD